jgi:hypothetical protein
MSTYLISGKYLKSSNVSIIRKQYGNRALAVQISNGVTLSINVPLESECLPENQFIFKNYSENEGLLESCLSARIIKLTGNTIKTGFVTCPIVELLV